MSEPATGARDSARDALVERLIRQLWAREFGVKTVPEVFLLLDGARDHRIFQLLRRSKLDHLCLFLGDLAPELARAAPYLVHLARNSASSRELMARAWGRSWGVFLRSDAVMHDLRRHFRSLLRVQDSSGKRYFFRFYDPRVLRVFLPTCTPDELRLVYGPVEKFLMEDEAGKGLLRFSLVRSFRDNRPVWELEAGTNPVQEGSDEG